LHLSSVCNVGEFYLCILVAHDYLLQPYPRRNAISVASAHAVFTNFHVAEVSVLCVIAGGCSRTVLSGQQCGGTSWIIGVASVNGTWAGYCCAAGTTCQFYSTSLWTCKPAASPRPSPTPTPPPSPKPSPSPSPSGMVPYLAIGMPGHMTGEVVASYLSAIPLLVNVTICQGWGVAPLLWPTTHSAGTPGALGRPVQMRLFQHTRLL
jgi:hypothetical protein